MEPATSVLRLHVRPVHCLTESLLHIASVLFLAHPWAFCRIILDTNRASRYKARTKIKRRSDLYPVHPWMFCIHWGFAVATFCLCKTCKFKRHCRLNVGMDAARIKQKQVWHRSNLCSAKYTDVLRWTSNAVDTALFVSKPWTSRLPLQDFEYSVYSSA